MPQKQTNKPFILKKEILCFGSQLASLSVGNLVKSAQRRSKNFQAKSSEGKSRYSTVMQKMLKRCKKKIPDLLREDKIKKSSVAENESIFSAEGVENGEKNDLSLKLKGKLSRLKI